MNQCNKRVCHIVEAIGMAVDCLKKGQIIGFPTETFYGLGVDPFNPVAIESLYALKKRNKNKPILILVNSTDQLSELTTSIPTEYSWLMERFWPGPLTLIVNASKKIPTILTGGTGTIGIRLTSNIFAQQLIDKLGSPVTATSANPAGYQPARSVEEVHRYFGAKLCRIVDGGKSKETQSSTVVSCLTGNLKVIRPGKISYTLILNEIKNNR